MKEGTLLAFNIAKATLLELQEVMILNFPMDITT